MLQLKTIGQHDDSEVLEAELVCGEQSVSVMNYGCVVRDWVVSTPGGARPRPRHIVLGFDQFDPYPEHSPSFGIIAGRVANRTAQGRFTLEGVEHQLSTNNGNHHLHGGTTGLAKQVWAAEVDSAANAVRFSFRSPDGDNGYPGQVDFSVTVKLDESGLSFLMAAVPDRLTPINLAQHNYYNLDGGGSIGAHSLQIPASGYLPVDNELIPTGEILPVAGTRFDFTHARTIDDADPEGEGHDHNLVLSPENDRDRPSARLLGSRKDLHLEIYTDQPGIQLYTGKKLAVQVPGHNGACYESFGGLCLEPQGYPDALNNPAWPSVLCSPENPYHQDLRLKVHNQPVKA